MVALSRSLVVVASAVAVALAGSCAISTGQHRSHVSAREDGSLIWPYWPSTIRVHPLTRIRAGKPDAPLILDARIEAVDGEGIVTRAVGTLDLELVADIPAGSVQPVVTAWTFDLSDLAENRLRFDDVTQTYLLSLEIPPTLPMGTWRLSARLAVSGHADLIASREISIPVTRGQ